MMFRLHASHSKSVRRSRLSAWALGAMLAAPLPLLAAWDATLSRAALPAAAAEVTPLAAETMMNVHLSLKIQNKDQLDALVQNLYTDGSPQYHRFLTPAQFAEQFSPSVAQAQKVVDYLRSQGFSNVELAGNRLLVSARGSTATVQKAFNTALVRVVVDGQARRTNSSDLQVPDSLGGVVLAVIGPSNLLQFKTALEHQRESAVLAPLTARASAVVTAAQQGRTAATASASAQPIPTLPPTTWDIAYDAGSSPDGSQSIIAISTYSSEDVVVVDDLRQMERQFGLPYVPVEVRETSPFSTPTPSGAGDDEWDLDTQSSTAIAHNVKKLIIYASEENTDLIKQYNDFATIADATAGNMSYGSCELDAPTGLLLPQLSASDQAFEQAAAEGLSWHASTGDDGGVCSPINAAGLPLAGVPLLANYPGTSPYVVAVGGTSLITDDQFNYVSESAWTSGGGGISVLEAPPAWQKGIVPSALLGALPGILNPLTGGTGVGRGVPDIAMNSGIYLPELAISAAADTIVGGTHESVVGTSLSSPLAAGAWARLQSAHCGALGFAAPAYYALDSSGGLMSTATGFHDVTSGTNGDYVATKGWDYTTGFGSLDLAAVNAALPAAVAGCSATPSKPSAALSVDKSSGTSTLTTGFDGSGSHGSGGIAYYTLDYGDDTLPLQQTSARFDDHTYTAPGIYSASLTVRNADGGVSNAATKAVKVLGMPPACTADGKVLFTLDAGGAGIALPIPIAGSLLPPIPDPLPGQDLLSAAISEPASMPGKLVFTIKVSSLSSVPPLTRWGVFFTLPNDVNAYYVAMATDSGKPSFIYGTRGNLGGLRLSVASLATLYNDLGTLDSASNYNADGTITLALDKTALNLQSGETLQSLLATTAVLIGLPPTATGASTFITVGETLKAGGTRFGYTLIGNDTCVDGITAQTSTGGSSGGSSSGSGGAFGLLTLLPLAAAARRRRRRR